MALLPILLALAAGLAVGFARRGSLVALGRTRVRHLEFLAVALACSLIVDLTDIGAPATVALVGLIGGLGFAVVNVHLVGMTVVALGVSANLFAVALNGAMPVRPEALVEAEMVSVDELDRVSLSGARELADDDTILPGLGDTYPVRWTGQVVSLGDLIMLVGVADVIANLMLQREGRRRRGAADALATLEGMRWDGEEPERDPVDIRELVDLRSTIDVVADEEFDDADAQPAASSSTASPVHD